MPHQEIVTLLVSFQFSICSPFSPPFPFYSGCYLLMSIPGGKSLPGERMLKLSRGMPVPLLALSRLNQWLYLLPTLYHLGFHERKGIWEANVIGIDKNQKVYLRTRSPTEQRCFWKALAILIHKRTQFRGLLVQWNHIVENHQTEFLHWTTITESHFETLNLFSWLCKSSKSELLWVYHIHFLSGGGFHYSRKQKAFLHIKIEYTSRILRILAYGKC